MRTARSLASAAQLDGAAESLDERVRYRTAANPLTGPWPPLPKGRRDLAALAAHQLAHSASLPR